MSLETFLATGLAVSAGWMYVLRSSTSSLSSRAISLLLFIHTIASLHTLLLRQPPNIFSAFKIPLNTSTDSIRALLLSHSDSPDLTPELDGLLRRLASFETRALYPRFGHNVLATCNYCQSFNDFALYALPRPLLSYIRETAFIGLITVPSSPSARFRKPAVSGLVLMAASEAYTLATIAIKIPPRGSNERVMMWHDTLLILRHIVFLVLPLLIVTLSHFRIRLPFIRSAPSVVPNQDPNAPVLTPTALLTQTHQTLNHVLHTLHMLKYTYAASMRVPDLRSHAQAWWSEEARVGALVRDDGLQTENDSPHTVNVRSVAQGLGIGFDKAVEDRRTGEKREEGKLRTSAKMAVGVLMGDGTRISEHWHVHTH